MSDYLIIQYNTRNLAVQGKEFCRMLEQELSVFWVDAIQRAKASSIINANVVEATCAESIALRITVRTFLNTETISLLTVPCSLFPNS